MSDETTGTKTTITQAAESREDRSVLVNAFKEAYEAAEQGRPGPAYILLRVQAKLEEGQAREDAEHFGVEQHSYYSSIEDRVVAAAILFENIIGDLQRKGADAFDMAVALEPVLAQCPPLFRAAREALEKKVEAAAAMVEGATSTHQ